MLAVPLRVGTSLCLYLLAIPAVWGQAAPRTDLYSDPLPERAIARCGTVRLRHTSFQHNVATAFAPDGKVLATHDGLTLRLWEVATGKRLVQIKEKPGPRGVHFSSDGELWLYTRGSPYAVCLLDPATGKELRRFQIQGGVLAFSPDGELLATATKYGIVSLWKTATGKQERRLPDHDGGDIAGQFTPDSATLVTTSRDKQFCRWNVATGERLRQADAASPVPQSLHLSPDAQTVAVTPAGGGVVSLRDTTTGKEKCRLQGAMNWTREEPAFTPDGRTLATLCADRKRGEMVLSLWDIETGQLRRRFSLPVESAYGMKFAPDGKRLASGHRDGAILVWDLTPEIEQRPSLPKPDAKTLERWWDVLAGDDAKQAHTASWSLIGSPEQALPLLRERLHPVTAPPAEKLRQLVADLDSEEFTRREAASKELAELEELAEAVAREALKEEVSPETRRRLQKLLAVPLVVRSPEKLRQLRAVGVLEHIASQEARQLLAELAKGAPVARAPREAKAALERLEKER